MAYYDITSGVTSTGLTLENDSMCINNGGMASNTTVNTGGEIYISSGGRANSTTVNSDGSMCVTYEAEAHGLTVSDGGRATVRDNASADDVTICGSGSMYVYSGGVLADATVLTGGIMVVSSGGILTGSQTYATGADVSVVDGGGFLFDVSGLTAADCANPFLNNLALVTGDPTFTLAVSNVQSFGTYTLADWATGFDKPVTVVNDAWDDTGVTLEVGVSKDIFGASHSLQIIGTRLVLIVGESENMEPADDGWNDTLYDKKTKKLNERVYGMDALAVTADTRELLIDTAGTVRALDDMHNFIGNSPSSGRLDAADFTKIELATAAKLSFNIYSGQAAKFTVWRLDGKTNKKGVTTYSLKALGSVKIAAGNVEQTQGFNLDAGSYYFSMESVNAKKGASCDYTVELASFVESDSLSAALAMPEADALADIAAFDKFATLDDASAWQSLLA